MTKSADGKIRLRCNGCGRRVKFPAGSPGETYRCPICHTLIVAPLDDRDMTPPTAEELTVAVKEASQAPSAAVEPAPDAEAPAAESVPLQPATGEEPIDQEAYDKYQKSIERVNVFIARESQRIGRLCREVLADRSVARKEKVERLLQLRHVKAVALRRFVDNLGKGLDEAIRKLEAHPAAETKTVQDVADRLKWERRNLLLYLRVMFHLQSGHDNGNAPNARTGTPAGGEESASTSWIQAAQTPRRKDVAGPEPSGTGPDSNGSPPC